MSRVDARKCLAVALCVTLHVSTAWGQIVSIEPVPASATGLIRPYLAPEVPNIRLANSTRLGQLVRAGTLYLTLQDAIALALENNIDLEVARYNPILAAWRLNRAQAGGALPGVPSSSAQVGSVASGQGVIGSQQAAGVGGGGNPGSQSQTGNATISQIGPVTQNLDPSIQQATTFSHTTRPQANATQSLTLALESNTRVYNNSIQQGFLSGGSVTLSYRINYDKENSPSNILNPSDAVNLSLSFQHNLLRGFGVAVNSRTITISRMNIGISETAFRSQVITIVTQVVNGYYALSSDDEDVKAKQSASEVAQTLLHNVNEQVRIGALAPTETTRAEAQVASTRLDLVNSQTKRDQDELQLKSRISRNGIGDPALAAARIVALDSITLPEKDNLPPLEEMVKQALANRPDIATTKANLETSVVSALGTKNGLLPTLGVLGSESHAGLAGTAQSPKADAYFLGGVGNATAQAFRRNFPTERIAAFLVTNIHNDQAQADHAVDQLQLRQSELSYRKSLNQVEVDILNSLVGLRQARARHDAAVLNGKLAEESLRAEQKKYELGASTPAAVIQAQRDVAVARATEVAARVTYINARVALDRSLGTVLEANHVSIDEARQGLVARQSTLPEGAAK